MSEMVHLTAHEISEYLLEQTGQALLSGDFEAFSRCTAIPHVIETPDKKIILKTRNALRTVFERVTRDYAERNVTALLRFCEVAEFRGPLKIEATHVTHMMSGSLRVVDPFPCFSVLEFLEGRWQCTASQYAVDDKTTVGRALSTEIDETQTLTRTTLGDTAEKEEKNR